MEHVVPSPLLHSSAARPPLSPNTIVIPLKACSISSGSVSTTDVTTPKSALDFTGAQCTCAREGETCNEKSCDFCCRLSLHRKSSGAAPALVPALTAQLKSLQSENDRITRENAAMQARISHLRTALADRKQRPVGTALRLQIEKEAERITAIAAHLEALKQQVAQETAQRNTLRIASSLRKTEFDHYQSMEIDPLKVAEEKLHRKIRRREDLLKRAMSFEEVSKYFCEKCNEGAGSPLLARKRTADSSRSLGPTKTCAQKCQIM